MTIHGVSSRPGGIGDGRFPPMFPGGGGGGGEGETVFFDDGQVKVTASLVTIGPPWNKVFAISEIRAVGHGVNRSTQLAEAVSRLAGLVLIFTGVISLVAGFWVGFVAGVLTGVGAIWFRVRPDAPFCVTLDFGDGGAKEYLSTGNEAWAEGVAAAVAAAMRVRRQTPGTGFFPDPQDLKN